MASVTFGDGLTAIQAWALKVENVIEYLRSSDLEYDIYFDIIWHNMHVLCHSCQAIQPSLERHVEVPTCMDQARIYVIL